jgi:hypothetical protein
MLENWRSLTECEPFIGPEGDYYYIVTESDFQSPGVDKENRLRTAKDWGIHKLLEFYGKKYVVDDIVNIAAVSETPDYFVSLKPTVKMRVLVKVPIYAFAALPDDLDSCDINKPAEGFFKAPISIYTYQEQIDFIVDAIESYTPFMSRSSTFITNINIAAELKRLKLVADVINRYLSINYINQDPSRYNDCDPVIDKILLIGYAYDYTVAFALVDDDQHTIGYDCFINHEVLSHLTTANYLINLEKMFNELSNRDTNNFDIFAFLAKYTLPTVVMGTKSIMSDGTAIYSEDGTTAGFADLAKILSLELDINLCKSSAELAEEEGRIFDAKTRANLKRSQEQIQTFKGDNRLSAPNVQALRTKFKVLSAGGRAAFPVIEAASDRKKKNIGISALWIDEAGKLWTHVDTEEREGSAPGVVFGKPLDPEDPEYNDPDVPEEPLILRSELAAYREYAGTDNPGKAALKVLYNDVLAKIDLGCTINEALQCYLERTIQLVGEQVTDGDSDLGEVINASVTLGKMVDAQCGFNKCNGSPDIDVALGLPVFQGIRIPDYFPTLDFLADTMNQALEQLYAALVQALSSAILRILTNSCQLIFDDILGEGTASASIKDGFQDWISESVGIDLSGCADLDDAEREICEAEAWKNALTGAGGSGFVGAIGNYVSRMVASGYAAWQDTGVSLNLPIPPDIENYQDGWKVEEKYVTPEAIRDFLAWTRAATEDVNAVTSATEQMALAKGTASEETKEIAFKCIQIRNPDYASLFRNKYEFADLLEAIGRMVDPKFLELVPEPTQSTPPDFCKLGDGSDAKALRSSILAEKDPELDNEAINEIINKEVEHNTKKLIEIRQQLNAVLNGKLAPDMPPIFGTKNSLIPSTPKVIDDTIRAASQGVFGPVKANFDHIGRIYGQLWNKYLWHFPDPEKLVFAPDIYENWVTGGRLRARVDQTPAGVLLEDNKWPTDPDQTPTNLFNLIPASTIWIFAHPDISQNRLSNRTGIQGWNLGYKLPGIDAISSEPVMTEQWSDDFAFNGHGRINRYHRPNHFDVTYITHHVEYFDGDEEWVVLGANRTRNGFPIAGGVWTAALPSRWDEFDHVFPGRDDHTLLSIMQSMGFGEITYDTTRNEGHINGFGPSETFTLYTDKSGTDWWPSSTAAWAASQNQPDRGWIEEKLLDKIDVKVNYGNNRDTGGNWETIVENKWWPWGEAGDEYISLEWRRSSGADAWPIYDGDPKQTTHLRLTLRRAYEPLPGPVRPPGWTENLIEVTNNVQGRLTPGGTVPTETVLIRHSDYAIGNNATNMANHLLEPGSGVSAVSFGTSINAEVLQGAIFTAAEDGMYIFPSLINRDVDGDGDLTDDIPPSHIINESIYSTIENKVLNVLQSYGPSISNSYLGYDAGDNQERYEYSNTPSSGDLIAFPTLDPGNAIEHIQLDMLFDDIMQWFVHHIAESDFFQGSFEPGEYAVLDVPMGKRGHWTVESKFDTLDLVVADLLGFASVAEDTANLASKVLSLSVQSTSQPKPSAFDLGGGSTEVELPPTDATKADIEQQRQQEPYCDSLSANRRASSITSVILLARTFILEKVLTAIQVFDSFDRSFMESEMFINSIYNAIESELEKWRESFPAYNGSILKDVQDTALRYYQILEFTGEETKQFTNGKAALMAIISEEIISLKAQQGPIDKALKLTQWNPRFAPRRPGAGLGAGLTASKKLIRTNPWDNFLTEQIFGIVELYEQVPNPPPVIPTYQTRILSYTDFLSKDTIVAGKYNELINHGDWATEVQPLIDSLPYFHPKRKGRPTFVFGKMKWEDYQGTDSNNYGSSQKSNVYELGLYIVHPTVNVTPATNPNGDPAERNGTISVITDGFDMHNKEIFKVRCEHDLTKTIIPQGGDKYVQPTAEEEEEIWASLKKQLWDTDEYKALFYGLYPIKEMVASLAIYQHAALTDTAVFPGEVAGIRLGDMLSKTKLAILQTLASSIYGGGKTVYKDPFLAEAGLNTTF